MGAMLEALGAADKALVDGADDFLQLLHVCSTIQKITING
jgi:hypothetical protein